MDMVTCKAMILRELVFGGAGAPDTRPGKMPKGVRRVCEGPDLESDLEGPETQTQPLGRALIPSRDLWCHILQT